MKKKKPIQSEENIILFPDLEKRLAEKGLQSLQAKRYSEAIDLLEKARQLDQENDEILIGLVLAYIEVGHFPQAKKLAKELLLKGIGHYDQMMDLYITILLQLHEYPEVVATIETLIEENEISPEKLNHFSTILQFSRRMADQSSAINETVEPNLADTEEDVNETLDLHSLTDPNEQMMFVSKLANKNIRPYVKEILAYLEEPSGQPFLKTLLLSILKDQEYEKEATIEKFNYKRSVIPAQLPDIRNQARMNEIIDIVKDKLDQIDPILLGNITSLVERHFFIVYPFELEPAEPSAWAAGFHFLTLEYYGQDPKRIKIAGEYGQSEQDVNQAIEWIKAIEEISHPLM